MYVIISNIRVLTDVLYVIFKHIRNETGKQTQSRFTSVEKSKFSLFTVGYSFYNDKMARTL